MKAKAIRPFLDALYAPRVPVLDDATLVCRCEEVTAGRVRKAVIPAAGFGTRLFPATKTMKKEFFPVMGRDGIMKPVILHIVEEAVNAGIEEVGIVVQSADRALFEEFAAL